MHTITPTSLTTGSRNVESRQPTLMHCRRVSYIRWATTDNHNNVLITHTHNHNAPLIHANTRTRRLTTHCNDNSEKTTDNTNDNYKNNNNHEYQGQIPLHNPPRRSPAQTCFNTTLPNAHSHAHTHVCTSLTRMFTNISCTKPRTCTYSDTLAAVRSLSSRRCLSSRS